MLLPFDSLIFIVVYYYTWQFRTAGLFFKDAAGMWADDFYKPYVAAIINIILNIALVKTIGINGVFISTIFCMVIIYFPWETFVLFKNLFERSAKKYVIEQILFSIETVVIVFVTYSLCSLISAKGIIELVIKAVACVIIPNVLFVSLNFKRAEFKYLINKIKTSVIWRR